VDEFLDQFFNPEVFREALPTGIRGFGVNLSLMVLAEACVLVWALAVALARDLPGRAALPLRALAIGYIDLFRSLPSIVVIYIVGFGLQQTDIAFFEPWSLYQLALLALTLVYGAYVAEVYRAGIDSVHRSQSAAARSLGLSGAKTMRFVVLPQAVRNVIPPLLNDFIGLQKDTALIGVIGVSEALRRAQIVGGRQLNATPYLVVALCYIVITVPMTRLTDYLIRRDRRRRTAGG
jgi:polar amino acid transport system permease protein